MIKSAIWISLAETLSGHYRPPQSRNSLTDLGHTWHYNYTPEATRHADFDSTTWVVWANSHLASVWVPVIHPWPFTVCSAWCPQIVVCWAHLRSPTRLSPGFYTVYYVYCRPGRADWQTRLLSSSIRWRQANLWLHETFAVKERRLSACIDDVYSWMQSNRLQLNTSKTELVIQMVCEGYFLLILAIKTAPAAATATINA